MICSRHWEHVSEHSKQGEDLDDCRPQVWHRQRSGVYHYMSSLWVEIGWGSMENILCPGADKTGIQAYAG